jgi:hypothetical protein
MAQERQPQIYGEKGQKLILEGCKGLFETEQKGVKPQATIPQRPPSQGGSGLQAAPPKPPPAK